MSSQKAQKSPSRQDRDEGVARTDVRELENFYLSGLHLIACDLPVLHKKQMGKFKKDRITACHANFMKLIHTKILPLRKNDFFAQY